MVVCGEYQGTGPDPTYWRSMIGWKELVCKVSIKNSQEELKVVHNCFDSDIEGDTDFSVQQNSSDLPCSRWGKVPPPLESCWHERGMARLYRGFGYQLANLWLRWSWYLWRNPNLRAALPVHTSRQTTRSSIPCSKLVLLVVHWELPKVIPTHAFGLTSHHCTFPTNTSKSRQNTNGGSNMLEAQRAWQDCLGDVECAPILHK